MSYIEYIILKPFLCVSRKKKNERCFFQKRSLWFVFDFRERCFTQKCLAATSLRKYIPTSIFERFKCCWWTQTNLSFSGKQCTQSGNGQYEAMWRVDLGAVLGINHITLYYKTENILWGKYILFIYLLSLFRSPAISFSLSFSIIQIKMLYVI